VRTLHRAVAICGGVAGLAKALGVSVAQLSHWLEGYVHPPTDIYIRALDLVAGGGYTGPKETR
jgi:DNA-binding transcriptional regulator YdaS (Cro superfamily)